MADGLQQPPHKIITSGLDQAGRLVQRKLEKPDELFGLALLIPTENAQPGMLLQREGVR